MRNKSRIGLALLTVRRTLENVRSHTAPELAPGINSEGAALESETAVSPASRSDEI